MAVAGLAPDWHVLPAARLNLHPRIARVALRSLDASKLHGLPVSHLWAAYKQLKRFSSYPSS
jgi:hypothetical protein